MIFCRYCDLKLFQAEEGRLGLHFDCHKKAVEVYPDLLEDYALERAYSKHLISHNTFQAIAKGEFVTPTKNHVGMGFSLDKKWEDFPYVEISIKHHPVNSWASIMKSYKLGNPVDVIVLKGVHSSQLPEIRNMYHLENKDLQELIKKASEVKDLELKNFLAIGEPTVSFEILTQNKNINKSLYLDIENHISSMGLLFLSTNPFLPAEVMDYIIEKEHKDEQVFKYFLKNPNVTTWICWKIFQVFPHLADKKYVPTSVEAMLDEIERLQKK